MRHAHTFVCVCRLQACNSSLLVLTPVLFLFCSGAAASEKRRHVLAQFYDELCRKDWAERAARGDVDFDVNLACLACDNGVLDRARIAYDSTHKPQKDPTAAGNPCLPSILHTNLPLL